MVEVTTWVGLHGCYHHLGHVWDRHGGHKEARDSETEEHRRHILIRKEGTDKQVCQSKNVKSTNHSYAVLHPFRDNVGNQDSANGVGGRIYSENEPYDDLAEIVVIQSKSQNGFLRTINQVYDRTCEGTM